MSRRPAVSALCLLLIIAACTSQEGSSSTAAGETTVAATTPLVTDVAELPGRLVVIDDGGNIVTMDPDGSDPAPITEDAGDSAGYRQPTFSPVADTLAWSQITADGTALGSSDGRGGSRMAIPMNAPPFYMYWSPDGNGIGVLHNSAQGTIEFEIVDFAAQSTQVMGSGSPFYFSWSPDSSQVAAHVQFDVFATIDLEGNRSDLGATAEGYQAPHWAPEGIFHLGEDGLELRQEGGEARVLATTPGPVAFVVNRQGTRVAVQSIVAGDQPPGINAAITQTPALPGNAVVVVDVESSQVYEVVDSPSFGLFWSPDGTSLLVLQPIQDGSGEISAMVWRNGEVSEVSTLSPHPAFVEEVLRFFDQYGQSLQLWSPDSSGFALAGAIDDEPGIWVHTIAGGDPVKVAEGSWVSWSNT